MATYVPSDDQRALTGGRTVNGLLLDLTLQHRHFLAQAEESVVARMRQPFEQALKEVRALLARSYDPSSFSSWRLRILERQLVALIDTAIKSAQGALRPALEQTYKAEAQAAGNLLDRALPGAPGLAVTFMQPTLAHIAKAIEYPVGGFTYASRLQTLWSGSLDRIKDALQLAVTLGEGMDDAAYRIMRAVETASYYNAVRLARTEIQRIANDANLEVYRANSAVIDGVQWIATLDDRTCEFCGALDMSIYYLNGPEASTPPEMPLHPQCRCAWAPFTKSWSDLGISASDLADFPGLAALDGQQAQTTSYSDWLSRQTEGVRRQILGPLIREWDSGKFRPKSLSALTARRRLAPLEPAALAELVGME